MYAFVLTGNESDMSETEIMNDYLNINSFSCVPHIEGTTTE
jgi:hypothetical protein